MNIQLPFDKTTALFLLETCNQTYNQFQNHGKFTIPKGYRLLTPFKALALNSYEWFGFILESKDSIVIACRGTQSDPDWIADGEIFQNAFPYSDNSGLVHHGFLSIYTSCRDVIMNAYLHVSHKKTLYITGHSLGAALATLHALDATNNSSFKKIIIYTYGSPRVGNPTFARRYNQVLPTTFRIANTDDIIPMLPPRILHCPFTKQVLRYQHIKNLVSFTIQTGTVKGNHSPSTYKKGIEQAKN